MSAWNHLVQALHSALIDELNARFPDEKPTLHLPKRASRFELSERAQAAVLWRVQMDGTDGVFALGYAKDQTALDTENLGEAVANLAHRDFQRRGIQPEFKKSAVLTDFAKGPAVQMMIVIPLEITRGRGSLVFDLGVGI